MIDITLKLMCQIFISIYPNAQLVKAFTTGVNSDLPTFPHFEGKMSLSLSNSLSFALIPVVKKGKNSKNSIFSILEVQFHHEGGLS